MKQCIQLFIAVISYSVSFGQSTSAYFKASSDLKHIAYIIDDAGQINNQSVSYLGSDSICNIEYHRYGLHFSSCSESFIRVDDDKVYTFDTSTCDNIRLLYDFAASVGDTLNINFNELVVVETSTIILGNEEVRPLQILESINAINNNTYRVVPGLGNLEGAFLFPFYDHPLIWSQCPGIIQGMDTLVNNSLSNNLPTSITCLSPCPRYNIKIDSLKVEVFPFGKNTISSRIEWGDGNLSTFIEVGSHEYSAGGCYETLYSAENSCDTVDVYSTVCVCPPSYWQLDTAFIPSDITQVVLRDPFSRRACVGFRDTIYEYSFGIIERKTKSSFSFDGIEFSIQKPYILDDTRILFTAKPKDDQNAYRVLTGYIENGNIFPSIEHHVYAIEPTIKAGLTIINKSSSQDTAWISDDGGGNWETILPPDSIRDYVMYVPPSIFNDTIIQIFDKGVPNFFIVDSQIGISTDLGKTWKTRDLSNRGDITVVRPDLIYMIRNDSLFSTISIFDDFVFVNDNISSILTFDGIAGFYRSNVLHYTEDGFKTGKIVSNINYAIPNLYQNNDSAWRFNSSNLQSIKLYKFDPDAPTDCRPDNDRDGRRGEEDCDDQNSAIFYGNIEIPYDGFDNDCDPTTPDDDLDFDGFGIEEDCNDQDPNINPDAEEISNGIDDNCDGIIDGVSSSIQNEFNTLNIYPSPARDIIKLSYKQNINSISIMDIKGLVVYTARNLDNSLTSIDCSNWNKGVYIVEVYNDNGNRYLKKIMVY